MKKFWLSKFQNCVVLKAVKELFKRIKCAISLIKNNNQEQKLVTILLIPISPPSPVAPVYSIEAAGVAAWRYSTCPSVEGTQPATGACGLWGRWPTGPRDHTTSTSPVDEESHSTQDTGEKVGVVWYGCGLVGGVRSTRLLKCTGTSTRVTCCILHKTLVLYYMLCFITVP